MFRRKDAANADQTEALLRALGARRRTPKGRKLPLGKDGSFVHYLDVVRRGTVLWEQGAAPEPTATETSEEDFHEVVFRTPDGTGYYLIHSEGFVESVWLGTGPPDLTFVAMGQWLSEHPDEMGPRILWVRAWRRRSRQSPDGACSVKIDAAVTGIGHLLASAHHLKGVAMDGDLTLSDADVEELAELIDSGRSEDLLLNRVVDRLRREHASAEDFFKHGQFGSHNSGR